jgi:hypothetical protein
MRVKDTWQRVMREKRQLETFMGQPVPKGYAGLVKLADGTYEYQVRQEREDGTWLVLARRSVQQNSPIVLQAMDRAMAIAGQVRGRTERVVMLDDANFRIEQPVFGHERRGHV